MPFTLKKYKAIIGKKIQIFLIHELGLDPKIGQRLTSKGRIFDENMNTINTGEIIPTEYIYIAVFEGMTRGLKPLIEFPDFAIFDKPTNLMVHPISKNTPYSLLDEIRFHFGENANLIHRIDAETSGLIIVGKNKKSEKDLKEMFQEKKYHKSYLAIVEGHIKEEIKIDKGLDREGLLIGVRMKVCDDGKESVTIIKPITYNKEKDLTLIEALPLTGRQHQIRVHLNSIGHKIIGDPIYGIDEKITDLFLKNKLSEDERLKYTKANRLLLQANYLEFEFLDVIYKFSSLQEF